MPPVTTSETQDLSPSALLKERRFKLSRACDRCRRRRIKCDEGHPCQACLSAKSACTFDEPGKRTHPHKSKRTTTLEERMNHLETLIQAIPPAVFASVAGAAANIASANNTSNTVSSPITYPGFPAGIPPPSLHTFPLTNPSTHFLTNPTTTNGNGVNGMDHNLKKESGSQSPLTAFNSLFSPFSNTIPRPKISTTPTITAPTMTPDQLAEETARMSLSASYLYIDDEGYTRWQGETSGLPLLDLLLERHSTTGDSNGGGGGGVPMQQDGSPQSLSSSTTTTTATAQQNAAESPPPPPDWFPNRTAHRTDANPEVIWRAITSHIVPELMDSLVQCYLSTSYYILPFLHVPTFLSDYGNPQKWGEPGFAAFIVAICCLASRHVDDPRVRTDPNDGNTSGTLWFTNLLSKLRTLPLPISDRPTLYTIQADLISAVYAVGLGRLSKAASLLSEAVTMMIDAGLHRSSEGGAYTYSDFFDPVEEEVRRRTFWCVYIWDKQLAAHFGRPVMIRLRDCDVGEPLGVDDEFISREGVERPLTTTTLGGGGESRMSAFIVSIRILVVLESVLDISPARSSEVSSPFLMRASMIPGMGRRGFVEMREEEALLDEIHNTIPPYWSHTQETLASEDTIRVTQAERLHCAEHFVRLLIYRHRFSQLFAERTNPNSNRSVGGGEEEIGEKERQAMVSAHNSALQIISTHLLIAKKGLMTYYGVHVIHQLTQAGRTLVAVLLNCKSESLQHLIPSGLEAVRSCVGLLRKFSGRYVCGLRSGDLMEEFCRLTQIPLEPTRQPQDNNNPANNNINNNKDSSNSRPAWIRPVRKKTLSMNQTGRGRSSSQEKNTSPAAAAVSQHSSPEAFSPSDFLVNDLVHSPAPTMFQGVNVNGFGTLNGINQFLGVSGGGRNSPSSSPAPFLDTLSSMGMDMDQLIRDEAQMYMSPEVLNMFGVASGGAGSSPMFVAGDFSSDGGPTGSSNAFLS